MGRDPFGPWRSHDASAEPLSSGSTADHEPILRRLAQPARVALLAVLGLGLAIMSIDGNQHAPLDALVASPSAPAAAQTPAFEPRLAYAEVVYSASDATALSPSPAATALPAETAEASAGRYEAIADEPVASTDDMIRELRPALSARGGSRGDQASLLEEQATPVPESQSMSTGSGIQAAPTPPPPTRTPTSRSQRRRRPQPHAPRRRP